MDIFGIIYIWNNLIKMENLFHKYNMHFQDLDLYIEYEWNEILKSDYSTEATKSLENIVANIVVAQGLGH